MRTRSRPLPLCLLLVLSFLFSLPSAGAFEASPAQADRHDAAFANAKVPDIAPSGAPGPDNAPAPSAGKGVSRFGPSRTSANVPPKKHAYSPFDKPVEEQRPLVAGRDYESGQVLIKLKPPTTVAKPQTQGALTSQPSLNDLLKSQGVTTLSQVFPSVKPLTARVTASDGGQSKAVSSLPQWYRANLSPEADVQATAQALAGHPDVEAAEPVLLRRVAPADLPDSTTDPRYGDQWHLSAVRVPEAWQFLADHGIDPGGRRDIVVAVIDTGVDYDHPDLAANMWVNSAEFSGTPGIDDDGNGIVDDVHGVNLVSNERTGDPNDDHGHGTHVAGIIAASGNNGIGVVGVAYNVQIMAIKAAQYSGVLSTTDIAEAIYYALDKGADVINMSFGGYGKSQVEEDALAVGFGQAVLVAAAGNDGIPNEKPYAWYIAPAKPMYPAAYPWVLGVMASGPGGGWAAWSNWDPSPQNEIEYELAAPGVNVLSTLPNGQYAGWDGTSMASPVVSGIAALVRSYFWDKEMYSSRFIMGQIATTGPARTALTGYPIADAYAALTTFPQPKLSYLQHWLFDTADQSQTNDDDGIVDAGETIDLAIVSRNHWGKADNVEVTLSARAKDAVLDDPYVTFATSTVNYGAIGSFNWDDNGLIYDAEGAITGVRNPFRFTVSPDTPNDHVIPFLLTMAAVNGLDPADTTTYTFQSRFNLMVQRGKELPRIISQNLTLTKDDFWIVPGQTRIEAGVTVTVGPGTQVQWGSPKPSDPYSEPTTPLLDVRGSLLIEGTLDEPVELFPSAILGGYTRIANSGTTNIRYARISDPSPENRSDFQGISFQANSVDHSYFSQDNDNNSYGLQISSLTNSIVNKMKIRRIGLGSFEQSLLNYSPISDYGYGPQGYPLLPGSTLNSVFLSKSGNMFYTPLGFADESAAASQVLFIDNAFLSQYWNPNISYWVRFTPGTAWGGGSYFGLAHNYWGTTNTTLIDAAVRDYSDDYNLPRIVYQPILTTPAETTYPFVWKMDITQGGVNTSVLGPGETTFTVTFNRDMDTSVQPSVSFGPDTPVTDYTVHPVNGGWQGPRTWAGTFNINPITGDGYQLMRIAGPARAGGDPWLVIGDDSGRFRFEIITSGTEAMNLQATGGEGYVDLMWTQDDFDLLAGYNLYRSTTADGAYTRLNQYLIPASQKTYRDSSVQPGQAYYYKFTVVKTDMTESAFSNVAAGTPIDTIAPVITHTPVSSAAVGLPISIYADVTDNVRVASVALFFRAIGSTSYQGRAMAKTTGNRYSATLEGSLVAAPGLEYYIEAGDGISIVRQGRADSPYRVAVSDSPQLTAVAPNHGPAGGGTPVTVSGSNFKTGASVTFGDAVAGNVTVVSGNHLTAVTPPHLPAVVDVSVSNPSGGSGSLLRGFTYESDVVAVSLPDVNADAGTVFEAPITVSGVSGLLAADITVQFNSGVLATQGVHKGALAAGFTMETNTGTPGQLRVSLASATAVTGSGVLAYLQFQVIGAPTAATDLTLASVSLNDGAIPVALDHGSVTVSDLLSVSGQVRYYQDGHPVPGTLLTLAGNQSFSAATDQSGAYTVSEVPNGSYTLTPGKSDETGAITAYDASLILQSSARLINLSGSQQAAADVDKSGSITAMDASYVLQKSAQLIETPFPGAGKVWEFSPPARNYEPLTSDVAGQDFTAILIGDVSGNWGQAQPQGDPQPQSLPPATRLALGHVRAGPSSQVAVPVILTLEQDRLYSADIVLTYDSSVASVASVVPADTTDAFGIAVNLNRVGEVRIAMAVATPLTTGGALLVVTFNTSATYGAISPLGISTALLNEGSMPVELQAGKLTVAIKGDVDINGDVDISDLVLVASNFGRRAPSSDERADLNGDGVVDVMDLVSVGLNFGGTRTQGA